MLNATARASIEFDWFGVELPYRLVVATSCHFSPLVAWPAPLR